ncbi:cytochrome c oxidase assembly protein [Massilia glaciei]|nr:cytochrome c oxidase assembly protein [Massilia glaciei]
MRRLTPAARAAAIFAALAAPSLGLAHSGDTAHHWWTFDPWVWVPLALFIALYSKGVVSMRKKHRASSLLRAGPLGAFFLGTTGLFLALIWPLDALGEISFAAHMAQHMVLIAFSAPLLVLARPSVPLALALAGWWPRTFDWFARLRKLTQPLLRPSVAFAVHAAVIWVWHAPVLFDAALRRPWLHTVEHLSFVASAMLFWAAIGGDRAAGAGASGMAALWSLVTLMHTGMLGALITFAPRLLYSPNGAAAGLALTPMEDQQLAGLIMWIPTALCYLVAGLGFAAGCLRQAACDKPPRF